MKKPIIALLSVALMFSSNYGIAVDATETASLETGEEGNGTTPFIINDNGDKVELNGDFDLNNSENNLLIKEKLRQIKADYQEANYVNKDVKGWLYFGEYVYQPYVDTPEYFDKYFRMNLYGGFDWAGLPFMSATSESSFEQNALIYGHNMDNGTAFGNLRYLDNPESFKNAPALILYDGVNDVFHFYKTYTSFHLEDGVEFVNLKNFDSEEERINYNKSLQARSTQELEEGWEIDWTRNALFLQHCLEGRAYGTDTRRVIGLYNFIDLDGSAIVDEAAQE